MQLHPPEPPGGTLPEPAGELWDGWHELSEDQRVAVVLRYYGRYRASEIAKIMDIPGATVRSHLKRGLALLRKGARGMTRFEKRLERDFGDIAIAATPSPTAWETIQARIAERADEPEMEIIMLQKNEPPPRRIGTWVLGAAAVMILVIGGIVLTRSSDEASTVTAVDEPPEPVVDEAPDTIPDYSAL